MCWKHDGYRYRKQIIGGDRAEALGVLHIMSCVVMPLVQARADTAFRAVGAAAARRVGAPRCLHGDDRRLNAAGRYMQAKMTPRRELPATPDSTRQHADHVSSGSERLVRNRFLTVREHSC